MGESVRRSQLQSISHLHQHDILGGAGVVCEKLLEGRQLESPAAKALAHIHAHHHFAVTVSGNNAPQHVKEFATFRGNFRRDVFEDIKSSQADEGTR